MQKFALLASAILADGLLLQPALRTSSPALRPISPQQPLLPLLQSRLRAPPARLQQGVTAPADTFANLEKEGKVRCNEAALKLFAKAIAAGCFVGLGGTLCSTVGGDLLGGAFWLPGMGLKRFAFGAIGFPLSIISVVMTGASAFTGNLVFAGAALRKKMVTFKEVFRMLALT